MAISRIALSGSTNGRPILVTPTSTPGETIHDAGASDIDEVFVWAKNSAATPQLLTIEYGGTSDPGDIFEVVVPAMGAPLLLVLPGTIATGSVNIDAFAETTNVISLFGFVNRIA